MIITCPCGEKRFEIADNLIPIKGRLLKCGSCDETWFFNKNNPKNTEITDANLKSKIINEKSFIETSNIINKSIDENISNTSNYRGSEIVAYKSKPKFTFSKFLSYILVVIISFIGLFIVLDTFKSILYAIFPDLEFLLFSLYETLKDIQLFIKDLI